MKVSLQPAYILHRRAYRETSFLVEVFTKEHGRLTLVAKGVRKSRSSKQGLFQPFLPLLISWVGKGELMTLTDIEGQGQMGTLAGECLFAGFYLNELLVRLLQKWDPHPILYQNYENTLQQLKADCLKESLLRSFEKRLLEEIGYGLLPKSSFSMHNTFLAEKYYRFIPDQGFILSENSHDKIRPFSGKTLLAIAKENWQEGETLQEAKRLIRLVLTPLLGDRPLYSRQLFMQPEETNTYDEN